KPLTKAPSDEKNCNEPVKASSLGFTRITCVVHPPPSAKCGNIRLPDGRAVGATGNVVIRKSERSFVRRRSAIAATGTEEGKGKLPVASAPLLNGARFRN